MMNKKYLLTLILFLFSITFADKGAFIPYSYNLRETSQTAIISWNGSYEILILSTNVFGKGKAIEFIPLPSKPKIEGTNYSVIQKIQDLFWRSGSIEKGFASVEVIEMKTIDYHKIWVVKANNETEFYRWIKEFFRNENLEFNPPSNFTQILKEYIKSGFNYFVFDLIEVNETYEPLKPLVYKFETDFLYYPLKITSFSDYGKNYGSITLYIVGDYEIKGFEKEIKKVNKEDLNKIYPGLGVSNYLSKFSYNGYLNKLNEDIIIKEKSSFLLTELKIFFYSTTGYKYYEVIKDLRYAPVEVKSGFIILAFIFPAFFFVWVYKKYKYMGFLSLLIYVLPWNTITGIIYGFIVIIGGIYLVKEIYRRL